MKLYYRISDKSYKKNKLEGITKNLCLVNFMEAFSDIIFDKPVLEDGHIPPIKIICDNCERKTIKEIQKTGLPYTVTENGNAGSLKFTIDMAIEECSDNELVYFCEDDYIHKFSAPKLLEEGIKRCDYVTLYDHPDKYSRLYNGGEYSKVIKTASSHWRYTISTCMTFGVKIKTLKEDMDVWEEFTTGPHPHDHYLFTALSEKKRRLAVCIPGAACHTDLTFSDSINTFSIDPWAVKMVEDKK